MKPTRPWYATNARELLDARKKGQQPTGPVVVSLIGGYFPHTTLYVHDDTPIDRLDWRMLVNLEVWVWADASTPLPRLLSLLQGIARSRPRRLCLRFDHGDLTHDVDVGDGWHFPDLHEFHWVPVALNHTLLERRLVHAAKTAIPEGTVL